jgi:phage gpG-like protein
MLHIEIVNDKRIIQSLQKAATKLTAMGPLMNQIGGRLEANIRQRFDTKTDPSCAKWADIKPISRVIYRSIHGKELGGSLMERSGDLLRSVEHHVLGGDSVEVGPSKSYAEFGTLPAGQRGSMVRRGMLFGRVSGQGKSASVTQALSENDMQGVLQGFPRACGDRPRKEQTFKVQKNGREIYMRLLARAIRSLMKYGSAWSSMAPRARQ